MRSVMPSRIFQSARHPVWFWCALCPWLCTVVSHAHIILPPCPNIFASTEKKGTNVDGKDWYDCCANCHWPVKHKWLLRCAHNIPPRCKFAILLLTRCSIDIWYAYWSHEWAYSHSCDISFSLSGNQVYIRNLDVLNCIVYYAIKTTKMNKNIQFDLFLLCKRINLFLDTSELKTLVVSN